jgi:hypothetical protein
MSLQTVKAVAVLGCPIYLLLMDPFAVVAIPIVTLVLGPGVWPQISRMRVFWFYGLGGPTGAWI